MHTPLNAWESFYVIVGSSAAALTGLQFVVIALIAEVSRPASSGSLRAYGTPNVIHFCSALLVSAILSAPWPGLPAPAYAVGVVGAAGLCYVVVVTRHALRQTEYRPVLEDWIWHNVFPFVAYGALLTGAIILCSHASNALFLFGGATLLLVFIGIHNSWDTVTFIVLDRVERQRNSKDD